MLISIEIENIKNSSKTDKRFCFYGVRKMNNDWYGDIKKI